MPEILLVRHGRTLCDHRTRIRGGEFARWVQAYEAAPLDPGLPPGAAVQSRVQAAAWIVTSTMDRARQSAELLAPGRPVVTDPLFDEVGIPTRVGLPFPLRPTHWDGLARLAWLMGWSPDTETLRRATVRAARGAEQLVGLAAQHGSVALVGHGMLNTLILRALRRSGWVGTGSPREYWGLVALHRA